MNAKQLLALHKQAARMAERCHAALPRHPAAKPDDEDTKDWSGPLGKATGALYTAKEKLLDAAKNQAIKELED